MIASNPRPANHHGMTDPSGASYPWSLQTPIYAVAFFTGNLHPMISVVMPLWALELGAGPLLIGLIISSRQILVVTLSIHGGALQDRIGPRRVIMVLGLAGAAVVGLIPVFAFVWAAIILQMLSGFAESTNWIGAQALVGRLLRGQPVYVGRLTAAARVGGFIGPVLTGLAWEHLGPGAAFGFVALWIVFGVAAAWFLPDQDAGAPDTGAPAASATDTGAPGDAPEPPRPSRAHDVMPRLSDYKTAFRLLLLPAVALVIMATVMRQAGTGIQSSFYGVWLTEIGFSAGTIGFLIGFSSAVAAGSALTVGPWTRRFADHWLLLVMIAIAIVAIAITPMLGTLWLLIAAIAVRGFAQGLNLPVMMSILARAVGPELQGRVAALRITFNRLGGALVPLAMGALAEVIGLDHAFYVVGAAGLALVALLTLWVASAPAFGQSR